MAYTNTLAAGQRAQRKLLVTVAEWYDDPTNNTTKHRTILGKRTEDSSIELNPDIQTTTDVLGITYTDVNKTEPQQDFDPHFIMGGEDIDEYLLDAVLTNDIDKYNNVFTIYVITMFIDDPQEGTGGAVTHHYKCVKHKNCTILVTSIGGDSYTQMNLELHYSNDIEYGYAVPDSTTGMQDFTFTKEGPTN